jgi:hypothetical protein
MDVIGNGEAERAKRSLYLEKNLLLRRMCYGMYIRLKYSMAQFKLTQKLQYLSESTYAGEVRVFS